MKHYKVMAAVAAGGSVPLLYAAGISAIVGNLLAGGLLALVGTVLAVMASGYERRFNTVDQLHSVE